MNNEIDKITREEISLIISVLGFSFFMGLFFGDGSFGFTLFIGITVYVAAMYFKWRKTLE
tara:strand:- start:125 stop:304 length:180 start_codon:yes stop_codon:yes gene_type:complete